MSRLPKSGSPAWHTITTEESFKRLESSPDGLSSEEVAKRQEEFGPNELQARAQVSPWAILVEQFKNVLIIILLLATALSAFLGHGVEAIAITVIVLFAVILGFIQEFRAERAMDFYARRLADEHVLPLLDAPRRLASRLGAPWRPHHPAVGRTRPPQGPLAGGRAAAARLRAHGYDPLPTPPKPRARDIALAWATAKVKYAG